MLGVHSILETASSVIIYINSENTIVEIHTYAKSRDITVQPQEADFCFDFMLIFG